MHSSTRKKYWSEKKNYKNTSIYHNCPQKKQKKNKKNKKKNKKKLKKTKKQLSAKDVRRCKKLRN